MKKIILCISWILLVISGAHSQGTSLYIPPEELGALTIDLSDLSPEEMAAIRGQTFYPMDSNATLGVWMGTRATKNEKGLLVIYSVYCSNGKLIQAFMPESMAASPAGIAGYLVYELRERELYLFFKPKYPSKAG